MQVVRLGRRASPRAGEVLSGTGRIRIVAIGERETEIAIDAYGTFGRGRHPAALNMGDCFAYACAKSNGATLLYNGDDFAKTDLA